MGGGGGGGGALQNLMGGGPESIHGGAWGIKTALKAFFQSPLLCWLLLLFVITRTFVHSIAYKNAFHSDC